jgi:hypothetical protein
MGTSNRGRTSAARLDDDTNCRDFSRDQHKLAREAHVMRQHIVRSSLPIAALAASLLFGACRPVSAQPGSAGGSIDDSDRNLSGPRKDETDQSGNGDVESFNGTWLFAGIGCHSSGVLPAIISHGKLIVPNGSGRVDPDGTINTIGYVNGVTQTAVGRLLGNAGSGTFKRSNGCRGTWTAIKQ